MLVLLTAVGLFIIFSLLPIKNNYKIMAVMSGSMNPAIPTGSVVVIKPSAEYKVDDIVTFKSYNSQKKNDFTTHRIVDTNDSSGETIFTTKGDANKDQDTGFLTADQIKGKVLFSIALIGYIVGYAKTLPGLVVIICLASIIIYEEAKKIFSEVKTMKKTKRKLKSKNKKIAKREAGKNEKS